MTSCNVCFHKCKLNEGQIGLCKTRECKDGTIISRNYGRLSSIALDPIEKKPIARFMSGSFVLSIGSFGCNLSCPFCQNYEISQYDDVPTRVVMPGELLDMALELKKSHGNIGVAYTYNEPLISYEYLRDCMELIHNAGMVNVVVSNGTVFSEIFAELLPLIDAINIDLKGFNEDVYKRLGGDLRQVMENVELASQNTHLEVTSLIVPGFNDSIDDMRSQAKWLAGLSPAIPLHITRYFPRYKMLDVPATDINLLKDMKDAASEYLDDVMLGNV